MICPTEMTIATGTTVYAGGPDSDERIVSREVRVSVTYRIDERETNVADLAFAKAAEVERARQAAQERIAAQGRIERGGTGPHEPGFDPSDPALEPPDEEEGDPFPEGADYLSARCGPAPYGGCPENGGHARNGFPANPPASTDGTERVTEVSKVPEEETDWATRPQVLALKSHFTRLGLSPENQAALLRARFGKFRPERLTKTEAAGLMRCLERNEWEPTEVALAH